MTSAPTLAPEVFSARMPLNDRMTPGRRRRSSAPAAIAAAALVMLTMMTLCTVVRGELPLDARTPEEGRTRIEATELAALVGPVFVAGMKQERIPGAAFVLVQDGQIVLAKGFGQADVAFGRRVLADRTIFPIASISKLFTATAVMQLVDRGRIDLDADVNRYLTSARVPPTYPQFVTAGHLLSHTAGFDELPGRRVRTAAELLPLGKFLEQDFEVGSNEDGTITVWDARWVEVSPLYFIRVDGRARLGFAEDKAHRLIALTAGSWRVLERID